MKLHQALPVKIICFLLCTLTFLAAAASIAGGIALTFFEFYTATEDYLTENAIFGTVRSDAYDLLYSNLYPRDTSYLHGRYLSYYEAGNTNLRYLILDPDGQALDSNLTNPPAADSTVWQYRIEIDRRDPDDETAPTQIYTVCLYLEQGLPIRDRYALISGGMHLAFDLRYAVWGIGAGALLLSLVFFILLMTSAGRRPGSTDLHPGPLNRVPFDLLLALLIALFAFLAALAVNISYPHDAIAAALLIVLAIAAVHVLLGLCMSAAVRIKQHSLLRRSLIGMTLALVWRILKAIARGIARLIRRILDLLSHIPMIPKTALIVAGAAGIDFLILAMIASHNDLGIFLWIWRTVLFALLSLYAALSMRRLQKLGNALAQGDLQATVDKNALYGDFRRHAESLGSIAQGMSVAVEKRLQSERMKTELITNVSHDIKTPLTSIVSYAGLIAEPTCEPEKAREYAEVLVRKSEHLKRLLEDLVEASKASTGNLEIDLAPCAAEVILTQTAGEFDAACRQAELTLITAAPDTPLTIAADSRRIRRVFENLMSNACKYSLPHSRVYLSLHEENGEAVFTIRNTSRNELNVTADELMERFVRGDASRTTEGSGLGLSIARSLTELQGGTMELTVDGDLFKVVLRFALI